MARESCPLPHSPRPTPSLSQRRRRPARHGACQAASRAHRGVTVSMKSASEKTARRVTGDMPGQSASSPLMKISGMDEVEGERIMMGVCGRVWAFRCMSWRGRPPGSGECDRRPVGVRAPSRGARSATASRLLRPQSLLDRRCPFPGAAGTGSPPTLSMAATVPTGVRGLGGDAGTHSRNFSVRQPGLTYPSPLTRALRGHDER